MECDAYGIELPPLKERFDRFDEGVQAIIALLTETSRTSRAVHEAHRRVLRAEGGAAAAPADRDRRQGSEADAARGGPVGAALERHRRERGGVDGAQGDAAGALRRGRPGPAEITCSVNVRIESDQPIEKAIENAVTQIAPFEAAGVDLVVLNLPLDARRRPPAPRGRPGVSTAARFVGRAGELAALVELLTAATAGHAAFGLVGGPAGIGKTRLLAELTRVARGRGGRSWAPPRPRSTARRRSGRGDSSSGRAAEPTGPRLAARSPRTERSGRGSLRSSAARRSPARARRRERFAAFSDSRRCSPRPPAPARMLVFDDLHWADAASLSLFATVVALVPDGRLVVVGAYRTHELATPARRRRAAHLGRPPPARHDDQPGRPLQRRGRHRAARNAGPATGAATVVAAVARTRGNQSSSARWPVDRGRRLYHLPPASPCPPRRHPGGDRAAPRRPVPSGRRCCRSPRPAAGHRSRYRRGARRSAGASDVAQLDRPPPAGSSPRGPGAGSPSSTTCSARPSPGALDQLAGATHLRAAAPGSAHTVPPRRDRPTPARRPAVGDPAAAVAAAQAAAQDALAHLAFEDASRLFERALTPRPRTCPRTRGRAPDRRRAGLVHRRHTRAPSSGASPPPCSPRTDDAQRLGRACLALPENTETRWTLPSPPGAPRHSPGFPRATARGGPSCSRNRRCVLFAGVADTTRSARRVGMARRVRGGPRPTRRCAPRCAHASSRASPGRPCRTARPRWRDVALGRRIGDLEGVFWGRLWRFDALVQAGRIEQALGELDRPNPSSAVRPPDAPLAPPPQPDRHRHRPGPVRRGNRSSPNPPTRPSGLTRRSPTGHAAGRPADRRRRGTPRTRTPHWTNTRSPPVASFLHRALVPGSRPAGRGRGVAALPESAAPASHRSSHARHAARCTSRPPRRARRGRAAYADLRPHADLHATTGAGVSSTWVGPPPAGRRGAACGHGDGPSSTCARPSKPTRRPACLRSPRWPATTSRGRRVPARRPTARLRRPGQGTAAPPSAPTGSG